MLLQVWRLKRRIGAVQEEPTAWEQVFRGLDRGLGYIVVAEPVRKALAPARVAPRLVHTWASNGPEA